MLFGLWTLQAIISLIWLFLIPTDAENGYFLGFTSSRLVLIGISFVLFLGSLILFFSEHLPLSRVFYIEAYPNLWDGIYILSFLVLFISPNVIFILYSLQAGNQYFAYAQRLTPLAAWFTLAAFELIICIIYFRKKRIAVSLTVLNPALRKIIVPFFITIVVSLIISLVWINTKADLVMGAPGIPLLEWQVILVIFLLVIFLFTSASTIHIPEKWLAIGIYIFTLVLWLSQAVNPAFTATPPRAPNFEIYPFSDPQIYVQYSQSALVGNGFLYPDVPSRPLYIAFLTWFHLLGSQDYNNVVFLQSLILAFFPVTLYFIGKELGSRTLGFALAILIAFRDVNANIAVPFASNVTYSKLFLSEMPLALCISLVVLFTIRWLKKYQQSSWMPLLIGTMLGASTLIRTQSISIFLAILLLAFLSIKNHKQFFKSSVLMFLALVFVIAPWLMRNYVASGGLTLDNTISQIMTMAIRWSGNPPTDEVFTKLENESEAEFSSRMSHLVLESFKENPLEIIKTATNHFNNNEMVSLMILPLRDKIQSPTELLIHQRAFWGILKPNQIFIFSFYIFLFGLGVAISFHRLRWVGLFPLILGVIYNAWSALFFSSGERFVAPIDWGILLYQLFGLIALGALILSFTKISNKATSFWTWTMQNPSQTFNFVETFSRQKIILICVVMVVISVFTPFTEFVFPKLYQLPAPEAITKKINTTLLESEVVIYGRAIYPRYYESGEGEPYTAKLGYAESEIQRLVFFVVGTQNTLVIFELDTVPDFFPHASDVYMIGSWEEGYFSPRLVVVSKNAEMKIYQIP